MEQGGDLSSLWAALQEEVHRGDINRPLWDALKTAKPVTIEGNVLAVGIEGGSYGRASSYLETAATKNMLQGILRRLTGNPQLTLQVVEGTTLADWERAKAVRAHISASTVARTDARREAMVLEADWDKLGEQLHALFAATENRRFAQVAAEFLLRALDQLADAEERILAAGSDPDSHMRRLGRALDKLASYVELPAAAVALEYLRVKERRKTA